MIRTIIADGLNDNLSADDIADQIENSVAFSPERADLVAKTEITRVNSAAAMSAYQDAAAAGVQLKKRWLVASADVCDECKENADAGAIALDAAFPSGDQHPGAHPGCRCAVSPVILTGDDNADDTED